MHPDPVDDPLASPRWSLPGYDLGRLLGFGATGEVWQARELATGEQVALKRLRSGSGPTPGAGAEALRREAAALAGLVHPHVLRLRSVVGTGEGVVLVLDLAAGGSLAALLSARGRLDAGEVVTLAGPLAQALAAAHARGLLHGDVTPSNVLFTAEGRPLLADLGVAGAVGESGVAVAATAEYLDPLVAAGGDRTPATDVHGLAACCYHALTGRPLFEGASPTATLAAAAEGAHPPLLRLAPDVPVELAAVLERALDPDPARRPTAEELARAVLESAPAAPVRLTETPALLRTAPQTHDVVPAPPAARVVPGPAWWRRRGVGVTAAVVVAVLVGTAGAALGVRALSGGSTGPAAAPPVPTAPSTAGSPSPSPVQPAASGEVDLSDPAADPTALYTVLSARRDAAVAAADVSGLAGAYTPDSPARTADERVIASLASRQARAEGFGHTVSAVEVQERPARTRLLLAVTDTLPAYRVLGSDGAVLAEQPGRGARLQQVELVLTGDGWRIATLTG